MSFDRIRIVLVATTHPGNIGATARAMKTMGFERLVLVNPKLFPHPVAKARASGADDVLHMAHVETSLAAALSGCRLVIGSSARLRTVGWPLLEPRTCAARLLAASRSADVALVFGREHSGLSNEEMDLCHYLVKIPTTPGFSSLNVAMAVQLLVYEVFLATRLTDPVSDERLYADPAQFAGFMEHLEETLATIDFSHGSRSEKLLRRLRRLFIRARLDADELNLLRGILSAVQKRKAKRRE